MWTTRYKITWAHYSKVGVGWYMQPIQIRNKRLSKALTTFITFEHCCTEALDSGKNIDVQKTSNRRIKQIKLLVFLIYLTITYVKWVQNRMLLFLEKKLSIKRIAVIRMLTILEMDILPFSFIQIFVLLIWNVSNTALLKGNHWINSNWICNYKR